MQHATGPIGLRSGCSLESQATARKRLVYPLVVVTLSFVYIHLVPRGLGAHLHSRSRLLRRARRPQMEARMMSADTPRHALTRRAVQGTAIMELGAALVPELVTSTGAHGGIAVVAGSVGERASKRGFPIGGWAVENALRGNRVWLCKPRHGCQQLGIPRRERAGLGLGHCCAGPM